MSDIQHARARAEMNLKRKEEQAREGAKAWTEYNEARRAVAEKILRLRALRLAKEAADAGEKAVATPAKKSRKRA